MPEVAVDRYQDAPFRRGEAEQARPRLSAVIARKVCLIV